MIGPFKNGVPASKKYDEGVELFDGVLSVGWETERVCVCVCRVRFRHVLCYAFLGTADSN